MPDLDTVNIIEEKSLILNDETFGNSAEERELKLGLAKKFSTAINIAGGVAAAWLIIWPDEYAIMACISVPLIALAAIKYFKGLIKVDEKKGSAYPSIFTGILLASCGLLIKGIAGYNILDYKGIWVPAIVITLAYLFLLQRSSREYQQAKNYWQLLLAAIFIFGYGYGSVVNINCAFDDAAGTQYQTQVLGKRVSRGSKSTTYYLNLAAWGPVKADDEVSVSKNLFNNVNETDTVNIYLQKGKLGIPWFIVSRF